MPDQSRGSKKKRHFSKYLVKIHIKYSYFGKWPNHLFDSTHLCTGSTEKEGQRAGCQCVSKEGRLTPLSFMFMHLVFLSCVYSVYNGQMSPNLQHLVFLDVKEVASV